MNWRGLWTMICLTGLAFTVNAQFVSDGGRFRVDKIKGCVPLTVTLEAIAPNLCDASNSCSMIFGDGAIELLTFTHVYTVPGVYEMEVVFGTTGSDKITITVLPDIQPAFEVYSCSGNEVSVKISDTNYNQYVINYNDGSPTAVVPSGSLAVGSHTYATAGNKSVTVRGRNLSADDNCTPSVLPVRAQPVLPAAKIDKLTVINGAEIQLDLTNEPTIQYKLEVATNNATTFQFIRNVYNINTLVVNNLRPDANYYCFRIATFDPCSNSVIAYSNTICSAKADVTAQNAVNKLVWNTTATGIADFTIIKTESASGVPAITVPATPFVFNDTDITCNLVYTYQLISNYSDGSESISLVRSATAISNTPPAAINDIVSVVGQNAVDLSWQQDPAFSAAGYSVYKTAGGQTTLLGTVSDTNITDPAYNTTVTSCYKILYRDLCGNNSLAGIEACAVQLTGSLQSDNSIILNWSAYNGYANGVAQYVVQKNDGDGNLLQTFTPGTALTLTDNTQDLTTQVYVYVVQAVPADPLDVSVSNTFVIIKEPNLYYPTAFTPNGDGLNDIFKVFGQYIVGFELRIFNRWGEMMYNSTDLTKGWDGNFKGSSMPEGTYAFTATITDLAGRTFERSGSVILLRKR